LNSKASLISIKKSVRKKIKQGSAHSPTYRNLITLEEGVFLNVSDKKDNTNHSFALSFIFKNPTRHSTIQ